MLMHHKGSYLSLLVMALPSSTLMAAHRIVLLIKVQVPRPEAKASALGSSARATKGADTSGSAGEPHPS